MPSKCLAPGSTSSRPKKPIGEPMPTVNPKLLNRLEEKQTSSLVKSFTESFVPTEATIMLLPTMKIDQPTEIDTRGARES